MSGVRRVGGLATGTHPERCPGATGPDGPVARPAANARPALTCGRFFASAPDAAEERGWVGAGTRITTNRPAPATPARMEKGAPCSGCCCPSRASHRLSSILPPPRLSISSLVLIQAWCHRRIVGPTAAARPPTPPPCSFAAPSSGGLVREPCPGAGPVRLALRPSASDPSQLLTGPFCPPHTASPCSPLSRELSFPRPLSPSSVPLRHRRRLLCAPPSPVDGLTKSRLLPLARVRGRRHGAPSRRAQDDARPA